VGSLAGRVFPHSIRYSRVIDETCHENWYDDR
jgi:hypothetical protein